MEDNQNLYNKVTIIYISDITLLYLTMKINNTNRSPLPFSSPFFGLSTDNKHMHNTKVMQRMLNRLSL